MRVRARCVCVCVCLHYVFEWLLNEPQQLFRLYYIHATVSLRLTGEVIQEIWTVALQTAAATGQCYSTKKYSLHI